MLVGRGFDLGFKGGYTYGYTLYATYTVEKLQAEHAKMFAEFMNGEFTEWHVGLLEGIEYAIILKKFKEPEKKKKKEVIGGLTEVRIEEYEMIKE
jgi:hypothetical protein